MQMIVLVGFLAQRWHRQNPSPHVLGILFSGGSDMTEAEISHLFLFEWLTSVMSVVLLVVVAVQRKLWYQSAKIVLFAEVTFLLSLGGIPVVMLFPLRWRQLLRLLLTLFRTAAILAARFCKRVTS
eukprot:gnl/MRDRNA2_/MRDRNA2_447467_c0_seq1.p1 gnl/MRDRNA2_/MRDRNA2_447467_c0~~gnl/MRDRNA2_/MRDRNA2_447467_c0_seq1.p1  ORF type:complete len:126 (+),score=14.65 gnl/MRDRNA2_/MRDRNA2_447467_c0_seq1:2-379(+)